MSRRVVGLTLLNVAGLLVLSGALYDLLVPSVPANHSAYLGVAHGDVDPRYAALDLAMLRSIGGCLLAVGITALVLTNGPVRRGQAWARVTVAVLVGVAEGNNAYRMFPFDSPWYGPLGFAVHAVVGAVLAVPPTRSPEFPHPGERRPPHDRPLERTAAATAGTIGANEASWSGHGD
jgi:hypothetical protein